MDWTIALLFLVLTTSLGYLPDQGDFALIISLYAGMFGLYLLVYFRSEKTGNIRLFLSLAVLARLSLLFAIPQLSDDLYRFVWDGRLMAQGINPFDHLPAYFLSEENAVPGLDRRLFEQLNSPEYFTIYPPVAQFTFALAAWLFPQSLLGAVVVMRLFLVACEIGSIYLLLKLLRQFGMEKRRSLLYALNPLIIIEITGNLHYEGAMIFFLLLGWWLLQRSKWIPAAPAMALSVASKLLTLLFMPFLILRLGLDRALKFFLLMGIALILLFLPLYDRAFIVNFQTSLELYFQKFEFNASIYYLLREWGYQQLGYNLIDVIGPILAWATFFLIFAAALMERRANWKDLATKMLFAIVVYLMLATTVHPWYLSMPVALCLFTRYRFPIVWSALIFLTYINYSYPEYYENLWIVAIEYAIVGSWMLWEVMAGPRRRALGRE
ncbi:MAG: hypothetical protein R3350_07420 [Saprospiraceae bacterium]|nr:hypothetical protein [Saprospiraceae bacterium]